MKGVGYGLDSLLELGRRFDEPWIVSSEERVSVHLAQELLRIRDRTGHESALIANSVQARFERDRRRQNIVVKARQMGLTTWVAGRFFLKTITTCGVLTVQVAQTREAAQGIFRIVQRFWERLPEELRKGCLRRSRANVGQMIFPELDSEFRVLSASDESAGRGMTIQNLHCSEVSRWPRDAAATLAGLRAALVPDGELVIESTPNGAYGCFYEEWLQASEKNVAKHFFPWWMEEAYISTAVTDLRNDELELMTKHELTPAQIGFRRSLEASYRGLRTQEFAEDAETCFRATGECCFDIESIEQYMANLQEPMETRYNGALQIWLPPLFDKEYLVAVDTAGGGPDGDYAAVQIIDLATGMQCAELQQRLGPMELARIAASLGREYCGVQNAAQIAVERNNHGAAVLAYLSMSEGYPRLYEQAGVTGWLTSASSKPAMISRMGVLLDESPELFRSLRLLREYRTFIIHSGGRTGAANGAHDDCLMAMAIAQAVRSERLQNGSHRMLDR
jgi:hypothetical protein